MQLTKKRAISKANKAPSSSGGECIGLDLTPQAIVTVLANKRSVNQIRLEKYAITPLPQGIIGSNGIEDHDQIVAYLQQAMRQLGSKCKNITAAVPQGTASVQIVQYNSRQTELSLEEFVELEVSQFTALDDASYDYFILNESPSGTQDILLVSCRRSEVDVRLDAFSAANISIQQMDVDILAVLNAFNTWVNIQQPELIEQRLALFHIGIQSTSAIISHRGQPLYKQELNLGLEQLMQLVRRNYQVSEEEAWGMVHGANKPDDFNLKVDQPFQEQLIQEIQRFLQFYYTTSSHDQGADVQHILVSGYAGRANSTLAEKVAQQVNLPAQQLNPVWAAEAGKHVDANQLLQDGNLLTVAFGLAVRGL